MTSEYLLLYHGTSLSKLESILKDGIMPRRLSGKSNWDDNESHDNMVYLTNSYAPYYSLASLEDDDDKPVVLEIKFDEEIFLFIYTCFSICLLLIKRFAFLRTIRNF